jgi:hypothetical protein
MAVAGHTNENPDKPQSHALAVIPLRRIFDTYDCGKQRCHHYRIAGRGSLPDHYLPRLKHR